jgi:hypothetical protein
MTFFQVIGITLCAVGGGLLGCVRTGAVRERENARWRARCEYRNRRSRAWRGVWRKYFDEYVARRSENGDVRGEGA